MTLYRYRLTDGMKKITASDIRLERGDTVELDEETAASINDRFDDPVLERASGPIDEEESEDEDTDDDTTEE